MGFKITFLWNRADWEGFSETYYTGNSGTPQDQLVNAFAYVDQRYLISAPQVYLYGIRISQVPNALRVSQFFLNTNNTNYSLAGLNTKSDADQGSLGALISLKNSNGGVQQRIFRGIPQGFTAWNPGLSRMDTTVQGTKKLNTFIKAITSGSIGYGWYQRSKTSGNPNSYAITAVTAGTGNTVIINAPGAAFTNPGSGPLILSGFRKPSAVLNGSYGTGEWQLGTDSAHIILTRVVSAAAIAGYAGVGGRVRAQAGQFYPFSAIDTATWGLVRTRRIGRPFGTVRGRRLVNR